MKMLLYEENIRKVLAMSLLFVAIQSFFLHYFTKINIGTLRVQFKYRLPS